MKLDQADYENIFLRVRERLLVQLIAIFSILFAIIGVSTWLSARAKIDEITEAAVNKYVQSDEFRKNIVMAYQEKLARLESQTTEIAKLISEQQQKAAQLPELPVVIDSSGLTLVNKHGHQFRIGMGTARSGAKILFKIPYMSEPTVLLTIDSAALDGITLHRMQAKGAGVLAVSSTSHGFEIPASVYPVCYRWVALGQQEVTPNPAVQGTLRDKTAPRP